MSVSELLQRLEQDKREPIYPKRIASLQARGRETQQIQDGIFETVKVLDEGNKSFVIYGEPQSGKTEFMIALTCKLIDLGYETIFVVMNDNTELENQNYDRFHAAPELNPTPLRDFQLPSMADAELKLQKQRIIFCRKNSKNLQSLIQHCRYMKNRIIIDDEADFATPNSKINKAEVTAINKYLGELGRLDPANGASQGTYIGVTATPARLDLNNTYMNDSRKWIFLNSHSAYKGRSFFFPVADNDKNRSDYILTKLPDEGDDPKLLRHAVYRFMARVALLNLHEASEQTAYSMLIHTAGKTNDHERDQQDLQKILRNLSDTNDPKFQRVGDELLKIVEKVAEQHALPYTSLEIAKFIIRNVGKSEVLVINHKNDSANVKRAGQPKALFTFAIGGNIVSRGLTFENLLTFFFSRNVKNKLQQNTYIQRARMFGTRPNSSFFELCVPGQLFEDWATCFNDHEISLRFARAGAYHHIQSQRTAVVDSGAIDKANVTVEQSERAIGDIFDLDAEIEQTLYDYQHGNPLECIQKLIEAGHLADAHFPKTLTQYILETSEPNQSDVTFLFLRGADGPQLQRIERSKGDGDPNTLTRKRGGIVMGMLNNNPLLQTNRHFILPIRNDLGKARFLYKAKLGQKILQNLRVRSA